MFLRFDENDGPQGTSLGKPDVWLKICLKEKNQLRIYV